MDPLLNYNSAQNLPWQRQQQKSKIVYQFSTTDAILYQISIYLFPGLQNIKFKGQNISLIFNEMKKAIEPEYFPPGSNKIKLENSKLIVEFTVINNKDLILIKRINAIIESVFPIYNQISLQIYHDMETLNNERIQINLDVKNLIKQQCTLSSSVQPIPPKDLQNISVPQSLLDIIRIEQTPTWVCKSDLHENMRNYHPNDSTKETLTLENKNAELGCIFQFNIRLETFYHNVGQYDGWGNYEVYERKANTTSAYSFKVYEPKESSESWRQEFIDFLKIKLPNIEFTIREGELKRQEEKIRNLEFNVYNIDLKNLCLFLIEKGNIPEKEIIKFIEWQTEQKKIHRFF